MKSNVVICPPCGENVALATKEGQNKKNALWPLLPRLTAVLPPQGREITTHGFTLIELLVVVLIIGILAAVAVPQYQKAVAKSRFTEILEQVRTIKNNMDLYVLEHGMPAETVSYADMDVSIEMPLIESGTFECTADHCYGQIGGPDIPGISANFALYFGKGSNFPGGPASGIFGTTSTWKQACLYGDKLGEYLCKSLEPYGWFVDQG